MKQFNGLLDFVSYFIGAIMAIGATFGAVNSLYSIVDARRRELATLRAGALYTEVDEDGWVQRELGIGADGLITHQLIPTDARPGWFGLARLSFAMLDSNVTKAEFESLWHAGAERAAEP